MTKALKKPLALFPIFIFLAVVFALPVFALATDAPKNEVPTAVSPNCAIEIKANMITAKIDGAPLSEVIDKITQITKVKFSFSKLPEISVFANFQNLALEEGIGRILEFMDYIFLYEPDPKTGQRLMEVKLLSLKKGVVPATAAKGKEIKDKNGKPVKPQPVVKGNEKKPGETATEENPDELAKLLGEIEEGQKIKEIIKKLKDKDTAARLKAVHDLSNFDGEMAVDALIIAQDDANPEVSQAAEKALDVIDERETLSIVKDDIKDPDPMVRLNAVEIAEDYKGGNWVQVLEGSLHDEDSRVRQKAAEILKSMTGKDYHVAP
ncbi:MAG: HEAT repeat domain-containing protein [Nitrospinae bacterium]|nr:HEAT repeat domain-containing protein [Nitrospinota bacterium]